MILVRSSYCYHNHVFLCQHSALLHITYFFAESVGIKFAEIDIIQEKEENKTQLTPCKYFYVTNICSKENCGLINS